MTEIPEHLLKRSRERREALGLPTEGGEAAARGSGAPRPPRASTTPAVPPAPAARHAAGPGGAAAAEARPPYVPRRSAGARSRSGPCRSWPCCRSGPSCTPAMRPPEKELVGPLAEGEEIYSKCSSCHGGRPGGVGYPFVDGSVLMTFPTSTTSRLRLLGSPPSPVSPTATRTARAARTSASRARRAMPRSGRADRGRDPRRRLPRALHPERGRPDRRGVPGGCAPDAPASWRPRGRRLRLRPGRSPRYEVLVIGGGPAGAATGYWLASPVTTSSSSSARRSRGEDLRRRPHAAGRAPAPGDGGRDRLAPVPPLRGPPRHRPRQGARADVAEPPRLPVVRLRRAPARARPARRRQRGEGRRHAVAGHGGPRTR